MAPRALGTGVVLAITVASAALALPTAQAAPAAPERAAAPAGLHSDFNGDGYPDIAFAAPGATVKGFAGAGYVGVAYGSGTGVKSSAKKVFTQSTANIPGTPEAKDAFGSSVVSADLDRDGYADLVVGSSGEKVGTGDAAGSLTVIWGGAGGLAGGATVLDGEQYDGVGAHLAAGDFNGDGAPDLATVRDHDLQSLLGPFTRDGRASATTELPDMDDKRYLDLAAGDVNGDGRDDLAAVVHSGDEYDDRRILISNGSPAGPGEYTRVKGSDGYSLEGGERLAVGNVNGDKYADLAVGRPVDGYDSDLDLPLAKGGMLTYVPGSATGPQGTKAKVFNQDSAGVPGAAEASDGFGSSVAIGDTNGDGFGEIAVGVPNEALGTVRRAGGIVILPGKATGPTGTGSFGFNQSTPDVPGAAEKGDLFGGAAAFADVNKDGRADLAVGAPGEGEGEGSLWFFPATASGLGAKGSFSFGHGTLGTVAAKAALGSSFNR
ncbi:MULTISPECIES: FG-GAP and VCBS repeat-containing protein [unclassified Streptomyces]|uniref:FG-GAP and VCBS repeat-containing protein n=1 Tax=unclassified Streptomyces TaxID=2593676 RepID=UPI002DD7EEEF|nr:FG-GAP and VCBS repeat-containing protein [Streptomyces sp. NBC_01237]WRZ72494.1 VCBS repeat-containing protein [Streptomyces sp. NBC_01237]